MKCFYHRVDLDGKCAGAIVKLKHPECEMIGINYGDPFPWESIQPAEEIYMVDFSLPIADMRRLNAISKLHWIDHHKTALEAALENGFLASEGQMLDISLAGCELAWGYVHQSDIMVSGRVNMPLAVYLLGRYDVWDHDDPKVLPFQYGMRQMEWNPNDTAAWEDLLFLSRDSLVETIMKQGSIIIQYERKQSAAYAKAFAFETHLDGLRLIAINRGACNSIAFESVYDPSRHDAMAAFVRRSWEWTVSLYSDKPDVDVSAIAKRRGGGGHHGAAGFSSEQLPFSKF